MKKTLVVLMALCGMAMAADPITLHGVTFAEAPAGPMQNVNPKTGTYYINTSRYGNGNSATTWGGLALMDGAGLKTNSSNCQWTFTYLYIDPSLSFKLHTSDIAGEINWSTNNNNAYFKMSATEGAWLDINKAYGAYTVVTTAMTNGTVYLNDKGSLTSTLGTTNTVHATMLTTGYDGIAGYAFDDASKTLTRTLLTGDFSAWTAEVIESQLKLDNLNGLDASRVSYLGDSTGLYVKYDMSVPEPATATLSLLALAGLAARRRR